MNLYQSDFGLPGTRILFDTRALAERVRPWLNLSQTLKLSISSIRYKPNTSCLVTYVYDDAGKRSYFHAKAFAANDWQTRKRKLILKDNDALIDDEFSVALFRFPYDADLPSIETFVADSNAYLSRVLYDKWIGDEFEQFETLAYKPNRRFTARLKLKSGTDLVLKIHGPPSFAKILKTTELLKKPLKGIAPGRAGKSVRHRSFVHAWIAGEECDLSKLDSAQCEVVMEQVFEYLDRLQRPVVSNVDGLGMASPSNGIEAIAEYLSTIYPPLAEEVRRAGKSILVHQSEYHPKSLIHGDFHERQIILSGHGVRACDFDNCCLGDPTADLANFMGHLHYRACLDEIPMDLVMQINEFSMCRLANNAGPASLKRYGWNQVAAMFRLATHPFRSGHADWIEQTEKFMGHVTEQIVLAKQISNSAVIFSNSKPAISSNASIGWVARSTGVAPTATSKRSVDKFRSDSKFKFLMGALDLKTAEHELKRGLPELVDAYGSYQVAQVSVRRHKPGRRCLLEFELATEHGPRFILGKAGAKRLDQYSFDAQFELFKICGFGAANADRVSVPRPLGICEEWNMWFQERVNAVGGEVILSENRLSSFTGRIANAMTKLHTCDFLPDRKHTVSDELGNLDDRLERIRAELPTESSRIERIQRNCNLIGEMIDGRPLVPIHRDFYQDQIMFAGQHTYLVDLDLISLGHPALDVGNFLAHLAEHGVRHFDNYRRWQLEEDSITAEYLTQMPHVTRWDIEAFKAISFSRHIFISWTIESRRKQIYTILKAADELTIDLIPDSHFAKSTK